MLSADRAAPSKSPAGKACSFNCENGRHSAISSSRYEINGTLRAECRHCGCALMRTGSSRRWFRAGLLGG